PTSAASPVVTVRRCERQTAASAIANSARLTAVALATTAQDSSKPGASPLNKNSEPTAKATTPPTASAPEGAKASPAIMATPSSTRPTPAYFIGSRLSA